MVTCKEMKELEQRANAAGLSFYQMMENAGCAAADILLDRVAALRQGGSALILCGRGNNGGDGFVAARRLARQGTTVRVILVEGRPVTPDALTNFDLLGELDSVAVTARMPDQEALSACDVIVDAIYGTGFHGRLTGEAAALVSAVNTAHGNGSRVAALDIPSGLPGDFGPDSLLQPSILADWTIAFHDKKPVHEAERTQRALGRTIIADIGIGEVLAR
ncbi:MAG: NAD(P)H-hydrate epimerase [Anaerovoracaceae bacterium]|jgi:NAD(P)H-hydrate epimerase